MRNYFSIPKDKLPELAEFIRSNLPSFRYLNNPSPIGEKLWIYATMDIEDGNKLSQWQNDIEFPTPEPQSQTFFQKLFAYFK